MRRPRPSSQNMATSLTPLETAQRRVRNIFEMAPELGDLQSYCGPIDHTALSYLIVSIVSKILLSTVY